MELASTVRAGLSACTATPLSPSALHELLRICFSALCARHPHEPEFDSEELSSLNGATLKLCHFGLMGLILEATRHAMEPTELGELLDEYKFSMECKRVFTSAYQMHFEKLSDVLRALSPSSPVLTDVSWRLGYSIRELDAGWERWCKERRRQYSDSLTDLMVLHPRAPLHSLEKRRHGRGLRVANLIGRDDIKCCNIFVQVLLNGRVLKNNFLHRVDQLNYEIMFHSENMMSPSSKDVSFSCSPEQLQDLIAKLKDAMKSIEKAGQA